MNEFGGYMNVTTNPITAFRFGECFYLVMKSGNLGVVMVVA